VHSKQSIGRPLSSSFRASSRTQPLFSKKFLFITLLYIVLSSKPNMYHHCALGIVCAPNLRPNGVFYFSLILHVIVPAVFRQIDSQFMLLSTVYPRSCNGELTWLLIMFAGLNSRYNARINPSQNPSWRRRVCLHAWCGYSDVSPWRSLLSSRDVQWWCILIRKGQERRVETRGRRHTGVVIVMERG